MLLILVAACPENSATCFECDTSCTTCTGNKDGNKCKGCIDPNMYLNKRSIDSLEGNCVNRNDVTVAKTTFIDDINKCIYSGLRY